MDDDDKWRGTDYRKELEKELIKAMHDDDKEKVCEIISDNWDEVSYEMKIRVKEMYKDYEPIRKIYNHIKKIKKIK